MAYLGRFQAGDFLPLAIAASNGSGVAVVPDAKPTAKIYTAGSSLLDTVNLPVCDPYKRTGFFKTGFRLDSDYSAGRHFIIYEWAASTIAQTDTDCFDVVAGGDADGAVIGVSEFARPEARYLLLQHDGGSFKSGRNPS